MRNILAIAVALGLGCTLSFTAAAQMNLPVKAGLISYDWSVNSAHSLALNPPQPDVVQTFVNAAFGENNSHVCQFRFANLRGSGNLSLITVLDPGGTAGCNGINIFDKSASGFENYQINASSDEKLSQSIKDINHDGHLELVLWASLPPGQRQRFSCDVAWPIIFAWTGDYYSDVSNRFRHYYEQYLKSLRRKITAGSSGAEDLLAARVGQTPTSSATLQQTTPKAEIEREFSYGSSEENSTSRVLAPALAAAPVSPPRPESGNDCLRIEAARIEALINVPSDDSLSYAVRASESPDPDQRKVAAVILSFVRTSEALSHLKGLAADSDPAVLVLAKERLSDQQESSDYYRQVTRESVDWGVPNPSDTPVVR